MGIEKKSLSDLIDRLITNNIKCFIAQDKLMESKDDGEIATYAKQAQQLNIIRNKLMRAIDVEYGDDDSLTEKTYSKENTK
jgi:hypothetical protein